ncbi:MAG: hypothetical protein Q9216_001797 [Gyalolechia sp. 2 TL-2023]
MVLKIGIEQIPRKQWTWTPWDENWISANYVNKGEPEQTQKIKSSEDKFNYGFNDFIMVECTPELAYQVHGVLESDASLPPKHVRAWMRKTAGYQGSPMFPDLTYSTHKHKSGYTTMAYGWGMHGDVLDANCTTNQYCDVEGPEPSDMYGDVFVKLIPLMIPRGLGKNDTFWIDLNKGVRALYFPARYKYSDDFPDDAAYAKISFVEDSARNLVDAAPLIFTNTVSKALVDTPIDLEPIDRKTAETIALNKQYHVGAYSFDSTLIVNVPKFIEASYYVSINDASKAKPHDAVYLAKSDQIRATRLPHSDEGAHWTLPPQYYWWGAYTQKLMRSYAGEISRSDQINLQETSTSDIGAGTEFFVSLLLNAASLIPYVGPLVSTMGGQVLENMKGLRTDSSAEEAEAAGIQGKVWNSIPGEVKDKLVQKLGDCARLLGKMHR